MKKDITPINEKGEPHGSWEVYWYNGQLYFKGNYVNDNVHGYWEVYYPNGQLCYKGNYLNGKEHGYWEWYHDNGKLKDKIYYI
jgi:antitoxin component YwqK of YwqJK toxin-antitoxin module